MRNGGHQRRGTSLFAAAILMMVGPVGCATMIHGSHQTVRLAVDPPGSYVDVLKWSGERIAVADASSSTLEIPRPRVSGESYVVVAWKAGYCPRYWLTHAERNGLEGLNAIWIFLPPVTLIAMIVDTETGAWQSVSPSIFAVQLRPEDNACAYPRD